MIVPTTPPSWHAARVLTADSIVEHAWHPSPIHPPPLPPRLGDLMPFTPITLPLGVRLSVSMTVRCPVAVPTTPLLSLVAVVPMVDRLVRSASVLLTHVILASVVIRPPFKLTIASQRFLIPVTLEPLLLLVIRALTVGTMKTPTKFDLDGAS